MTNINLKLLLLDQNLEYSLETGYSHASVSRPNKVHLNAGSTINHGYLMHITQARTKFI